MVVMYIRLIIVMCCLCLTLFLVGLFGGRQPPSIYSLILFSRARKKKKKKEM